MVCREVLSESSIPPRPIDKVDWSNPREINCIEMPEECGDHPPGVDFDVEYVSEEDLSADATLEPSPQPYL